MQDRFSFIERFIAAINLLHMSGYVHTDFTLENVMMNMYDFKIIDLLSGININGMSDDTKNKYIASDNWMALIIVISCMYEIDFWEYITKSGKQFKNQFLNSPIFNSEFNQLLQDIFLRRKPIENFYQILEQLTDKKIEDHKSYLSIN